MNLTKTQRHTNKINIRSDVSGRNLTRDRVSGRKRFALNGRGSSNFSGEMSCRKAREGKCQSIKCPSEKIQKTKQNQNIQKAPAVGRQSRSEP